MYDHVAPWSGDRFGPGLRVPTIVASPFHGPGINSNPYEHLSIVKMIQQRFGLPMNSSTGNPLMGAARDISTRDFTNSFLETPVLWTDPAVPADNNVPPPQAAIDALNKYDHIINIWLAGNSFDYLFGAFAGANGAARANAAWNPQRPGPYNTNPPNAPYSCLPTNATKEFYPTNALPASVPLCWPNTGMFPVDVAVPLINSTSGASVTWKNDPSHDFYSDIYSINNGKNDLYVYYGGINAFSVSYYQTSLQGSYLWQLAQNYTLFDNFFKSSFGDSDINFLIGVAAGQPIYWGDSPTAG